MCSLHIINLLILQEAAIVAFNYAVDGPANALSTLLHKIFSVLPMSPDTAPSNKLVIEWINRTEIFNIIVGKCPLLVPDEV